MDGAGVDVAFLERARRFSGLIVAGVLALGCGRGDAAAAIPAHVDAARVTVEVLNASGRAGYARRATRALREAGLDVLFYGNAAQRRDTTVILVRTGDVGGGRRVARALGAGEVMTRSDGTRRVDVSVLLGRDWVPPPDPRP